MSLNIIFEILLFFDIDIERKSTAKALHSADYVIQNFVYFILLISHNFFYYKCNSIMRVSKGLHKQERRISKYNELG